MKRYLLISVLCIASCFSSYGQVADMQTYLMDIKKEMVKKWPHNRTINVVFHGHSVPTGYARTPFVNTLHAYPHLVLDGLKSQYPNAAINVITTSIGGEQAEQGAKRMNKEVLTHRPDVLFIDYALNDRSIGVERSEKAWRKMIVEAKKYGTKIILMTPTPDIKENILDNQTPLAAHTAMIYKLAREYQLGLVDSYGYFKQKAKEGAALKVYMSQNNHPNALGHMCVASEVLPWFY